MGEVERDFQEGPYSHLERVIDVPNLVLKARG
jgi:hypothetical protein